jgi:hypothetical protein
LKLETVKHCTVEWFKQPWIKWETNQSLTSKKQAKWFVFNGIWNRSLPRKTLSQSSTKKRASVYKSNLSLQNKKIRKLYNLLQGIPYIFFQKQKSVNTLKKLIWSSVSTGNNNFLIEQNIFI